MVGRSSQTRLEMPPPSPQPEWTRGIALMLLLRKSRGRIIMRKFGKLGCFKTENEITLPSPRHDTDSTTTAGTGRRVTGNDQQTLTEHSQTLKLQRGHDDIIAPAVTRRVVIKKHTHNPFLNSRTSKCRQERGRKKNGSLWSC